MRLLRQALGLVLLAGIVVLMIKFLVVMVVMAALVLAFNWVMGLD